MDNLVLFVKLNSGVVGDAIQHVKRSLQYQQEHYYYTSETDTETVDAMLESLGEDGLFGCRIVFIVYRRKHDDILIQTLYVGRISRVEAEGVSYQIHYEIESKVESPLVVDNFMKFSNLNIVRDFQENSHISIEDSAALLRQLSYAVQCPQNIAGPAQNYPVLASESALSPLAQRNEYCRRQYNVFPPSQSRGEYQRDYDRIVHCKAFRRMVDKAQIFTSSKGDHYRTRMTHTLCVAQIARSMAARLKMNVPLTEAIALGHDLGHTPFGHQGERTLNQMAQKHGVKGFKHNFQSMHVASVLEEEYIECSGLDLSFQTLEGMWKHTRIRKGKEGPMLCGVMDFLPSDLLEEQLAYLRPDKWFCSTVEGQLVFIADEIAQRSHDLDDALSAGLLTVDGLLETLSLKKLHALKEKIERLKEKIGKAEGNQRVFVSKEELLVSRISSEVINYFIDDVCESFERFLSGNDAGVVQAYFQQNQCVNRQVVSFSSGGQVLNDYLETIVTKQVINSAEVAGFDDKAARVTAKLFELYYENPRLLHDGTLQRIYIEMRRKSDNAIHFQEGDIGLVNGEWERIKHPETSPRLRDLREEFPDDDLAGDGFADVAAFLNTLHDREADAQKVVEYCERCEREYEEKKKILVRAICDFISGMTDTYALKEYRKLTC